MAHRFSLFFFLCTCLLAAPCAAQVVFSGPNFVNGFNNTGGVIPDLTTASTDPVTGFNTNVATSTATITDTRIVQNVRFRIQDLTHEWVGDLVATVTHTGINQFGVQDTVQARLFERTGRQVPLLSQFDPGDSSNVDGTYFFRDDATTINNANSADWWQEAANQTRLGVLLPESYVATNSADIDTNLDGVGGIFTGRQAGGDWTLILRDDNAEVVGTFGGFVADIIVANPAVPEPASGIMLFTTAMFFLRRRRA